MDMMMFVMDMMDKMTMLYDDRAQYMMTMLWIGYDVKQESAMATNELNLLIIVCWLSRSRRLRIGQDNSNKHWSSKALER